MKKLIFAIVGLVSGFVAYGQTELNNFELKYKGGYGATPKEIVEYSSGLLDTIRLGEVNSFEIGGAAYLNCGFGIEGAYEAHNRYFDTLAGSGSSYSVGLAYRKAFYGPGHLFDNGFNMAVKVGAGYIHAEKTDQIEYISIAEGVSTSRIWQREKSFSGFYVNGKMDIFRDDPYSNLDYFFYGISVSGSYKYPMMNKLSEMSNGNLITPSWNKDDSVSVFDFGVEIKPVIIPLNRRMGVSLITAVNYGNFNAYNVYDPGVNLKVGVSLDGFTKFGECARITYTCAPRETYVSNEVSFGIELIQLATTLFGR